MSESSFHVIVEGHVRLCWILKLCCVIRLHEIAFRGLCTLCVLSRSEDLDVGH